MRSSGQYLRHALVHRMTSTVQDVEKVAYSYAEQVAYLTVLWIALILAIIWFLMRYANRSLFKWHTWINVSISYFTAIGILVLIPLDVVVTKLIREASSQHQYHALQVYSKSLYNLYNALFWPTQIFANILLVFFEEYNESGYFTVGTRVWDAFKNLGKMLLLGLVAGGILLAILLGGGYSKDQDALLVTILALNNTYGLVVIIFLLGYGLVELPKQMWMNGNLQGKLRRLRGKASYEFRHLADASMDMSEIVAHALKTKGELERSKDEELIKLYPKIMKECPDEFKSQAGGVVQKDKKGKITKDILATMRKNIKMRKAKYLMCQSRVERIKRQVFALEDIVAAKHRPDKTPRIKYASGMESKVSKFFLECYVRPIAGRIFSLMVIAMCLSVLFAEVGLMAGESSSVAVLSRAAHNPSNHPGGLIVLNLFYLGFICWVMIFALSQLRVADVMEIVPEQKTTPRSMSFNARLTCKLAPPLAYNFLTLCFESGVETGSWMNSRLTGQPVGSAFSTFYGSMDIIPFLGNNFNKVFPIFILVLACLQGLNVFNRILRYLNLGALQFGDPPMSKKDLDEGLKKLQKYRQHMEAQSQREERMRKIRGGRNENSNSPAALAPGLKITPLGARDDLNSQGTVGGDESDDDQVLAGYDAAVPGHGRYNAALGPPPSKEGFMEKKTGRESVGGGWQSRYFVIRLDGVLVQHKKQDKAGGVLGSLDLSKIQSINLAVSKDGMTDATRLNLETAEGTMKLRCRSEDIAAEWRSALLDWKEYAMSQKMSGRIAAKVDEEACPTTTAATGSTGGISSLMSSIGIRANGLNRPTTTTSNSSNSAFSVPSSTGTASSGMSRGSKKQPVMPKVLGGKLQLGNGLFGTYAEKNFAVKTTDCTLKYYKAGEPTTGPAAGSIDLLTVDKVTFEEPKQSGTKRDPTKFVIILEGGGQKELSQESMIKLRADTPEEAEKWINGITEWSNYFKAVVAHNTSAGMSPTSAKKHLL